MTAEPATDSITRSIDVPVSPAHAWNGFVRDFARWWPREHCFCGEDALDRVFIDLDQAIWGEVTQDGRMIPWGAVLAASAPASLDLGWQMDATVSPWVPEPEADKASTVRVGFQPRDGGTRVTLTHEGFSRQGPVHAEAMRAVMIGMDRWAEWLADYAASLHDAGPASQP